MALGMSGVYTGLNTEAWVQNITSAQNQRVYSQVIKKQGVIDRQSAWQRIQTALNSLQTQSDMLGKVDTYRARTATVADNTIADASAVSGAALGSHALSVTSLAAAHVVSAKSDATSADAGLGLSGTVTINGKALALATTDSLNTVRDKINALGANVTASVVPVISGTTTTYTMQLASNKLGTANAITMSGADAQSTALNFLDAAGAWTNQVTAATDAVFTLDGSNYTMDTNNISTVLPNVSFTLKKAGSTTINVTQNADAIVASVQSWANAVNAAIGQIDTETKVALKDGRLDGSVKKSPLSGDSVARTLRQSLSSMLSQVVGGLPSKQNRLSDFGITTGAWGSADYGKVVVDTTKLKAAVQSDPDALARVFGAITGANTTGVATDMSKFLKTELTPATGPLALQNTSYDKQIKQISDNISRLNDQISKLQDSLRKQFARMEAAVAQMRSQGSAFTAHMSMFSNTGF